MAKKVFLIMLVVSFIFTFASPLNTNYVNAGGICDDQGCLGCENPKINLNCQRQKFLDPNTQCTLFYCADNGEVPTDVESTIRVNLFGVYIRLNNERAFSQMIFLIFNLVLGVIAITIMAMGLLGVVRRARAESPDDISAASKIMTNALVGFVLIVLSLLFAQLVGSFLGVGNISELVDFSPLFSNNVEEELDSPDSIILDL